MADSDETTHLLRAWTGGDHAAGDQLFVRLYEDLRVVASRRLAGEAAERTLLTTDLVHEAFLRLVNQTQARWADRSQFFAVAARVMRRIVIDHARSRLADKRGGAMHQVTLSGVDGFAMTAQPQDLVALDQCLDDLARHDAERARLVELRFFAGLSLEDTATILGVSRATVVRQWKVTKGWLHRQLSAP